MSRPECLAKVSQTAERKRVYRSEVSLAVGRRCASSSSSSMSMSLPSAVDVGCEGADDLVG